MKVKKKLLIIGSAGVRLRLQCERLPYAGEKADGVKYAYAPDTLAAASAVCAVGMGTEAVLLTRVGPDANGTKLVSLLQKKGVDTRFAVKDQKEATSLTVALEEDAADTRQIRYKGASVNLTENDVEEAFNCYPDGVLLRLEGSEESLRAAERFAAEREVPLFVCAADIEKADSVYLPPKCHTFIGDAKSVLALVGMAPSNPDAALRCAIEMSRKISARHIIFRMNNGCIYVYDGSFGRILDKISKGHSFGDVFPAAYVCEFLKCGNILASAKFALATAMLWEACGETFDTVPTAAEVREDAGI